MSLFPAASLIKVKEEKTSPVSSNDWLKNQSYHPDKAQELVKLQTHREQDDSATSTDSETNKPPNKAKKLKKAKKRKRSPPRSVPVKREVVLPIRADLPKGQKLSVIVDQLTDDSPKYCSDLIADMDNVHFKRPYKVQGPKFYRHLMYCIGTPRWKLLLMKEKKGKKKRNRSETNDRYFNVDVSQYVSVANTKISDENHAHPVPAVGENFIKLPKEDENEVRHIDANDFSEVNDPHLEIRKRTEYLNRRTREKPQDVDGWLELVSWQDEALKDTVVLGRSRVICEKKIEILNHAIKANPKVAELQLMKVSLLPEVLSDADAIDKEWQNLLFRFPDNLDVWQKYIFHITCNSYNTFTMKRTRRAFAHCLEILRSIKEGTYKQQASQSSVEWRLVQVFTQYCDFLHATGHTEQLVAAFQYTLELNFRGPEEKRPLSETIDDLKKYFASEEKKLGEAGSKGFRTWLSKHEKGGWVTHDVNEDADAQSESDDDDDEDVDADKDLAENWLKLEHGRSERHWLPWRPAFEGDECDDEERKVPFSEIKDLMFIVDKHGPKLELLRNFLRVLGCQIGYHSTNSPPFSSQHPFLFLHPHEILKSHADCYGPNPLLRGHGTLQHTYSNVGPCVGCRSGALSPMKHKFICELFAQLFLAVNDKGLKTLLRCEYMLYHECRVISFYVMRKVPSLKKSGKEARKVAKLILSKEPDLLDVWRSLGVVEWLCGKREEACKVFQTTLAMSVPLLSQMERVILRQKLAEIYRICRTLAELHFFTCASCMPTLPSDSCKLLTPVLLTLAALGDGYKFADYVAKKNAIHPTERMKATSGFATLSEELASLYEQEEYHNETNDSGNGPPSSYADVVVCHVVFLTMLHSDAISKIDEAETFLQKQITKGSKQAYCDIEHLKYIKIIILRQNLSKDRRAHRDAVYSAAAMYPNNPIFAQMLCEVDISSYISGNVRKHFAKSCGEHANSVVPWLCAVRFELMRRRRILEASSVEQGTNETGRLMDARIRNLFEHSLAVIGNSGCVVLWRAYIAAEAEMCPERVRGIYTRAVDACSWSRDLHLDLLSHQPQLLKDVVTNLSKKGLRLRTPVEEVQLLMSAG